MLCQRRDSLILKNKLSDRSTQFPYIVLLSVCVAQLAYLIWIQNLLFWVGFPVLDFLFLEINHIASLACRVFMKLRLIMLILRCLHVCGLSVLFLNFIISLAFSKLIKLRKYEEHATRSSREQKKMLNVLSLRQLYLTITIGGSF